MIHLYIHINWDVLLDDVPAKTTKNINIPQKHRQIPFDDSFPASRFFDIMCNVQLLGSFVNSFYAGCFWAFPDISLELEQCPWTIRSQKELNSYIWHTVLALVPFEVSGMGKTSILCCPYAQMGMPLLGFQLNSWAKLDAGSGKTRWSPFWWRELFQFATVVVAADCVKSSIHSILTC